MNNTVDCGDYLLKHTNEARLYYLVIKPTLNNGTKPVIEGFYYTYEEAKRRASDYAWANGVNDDRFRVEVEITSVVADFALVPFTTRKLPM